MIEITCHTCGWIGSLEDCEINDWNEHTCPECGEPVEIVKEEE